MDKSTTSRFSRTALVFCCLLAFSCDDKSVTGFVTDPPILPQVHSYPEWSANGDSLYFVEDGATELHKDGSWSTNPDSSGLRVIARTGGAARLVFNSPPFFTYGFSPDRSTVCLAGGGDLFVGAFVNGRLDPFTFAQITNIGGAFYPKWSPDGTWIAFDTGYNDPHGASVVWKVRPDGSDLVDISVHGTGEWREPCWDPSGTRLVYVRYVADTDAAELFVMNADGSNNKRVTRNNIMDLSPRFSPDGSQICYERGDGRPVVCVVNANGSGFRALAHGESPVWSPDGKEIAYVALTDKPRTNGTIWVMRSDGSRQTQVTRSRLR